MAFDVAVDLMQRPVFVRFPTNFASLSHSFLFCSILLDEKSLAKGADNEPGFKSSYRIGDVSFFFDAPVWFYENTLCGAFSAYIG